MSTIDPFKDHDEEIDELSTPIYFGDQTQHSSPRTTPSIQLRSPSPIYEYEELQNPEPEAQEERSDTDSCQYSTQPNQEALCGFPTAQPHSRHNSKKSKLHRIKKLRNEIKQVQHNARGRKARASVYQTASQVKTFRGLVKKLKRRAVELTESLMDREKEKLYLERVVLRLRGEKEFWEKRVKKERVERKMMYKEVERLEVEREKERMRRL